MALEQTRFSVWDLNPNDVATFLIVLILSLPVLLRWSKYWIWFVWPAETILFVLVVGTGSRGGVLALICGAVVGLYGSKRLESRRLGWRPWVVMISAILIGTCGGLAAFPKGFRLASVDLSPEASAGRRLEVWSRVPEMLAAAPNGWGVGKSAEAYEQWYEPVGENIQLKHLLSSHLTWLVEFGWPLRWLYLFSWMGVFALLLPSRNFRFSSLGAAAWSAFFVALFYNAAGKWWNWPLPVLWLVVIVFLRIKQRNWPRWPSWLAFVILAGVFDALPFIVCSLYRTPISIRAWDGGNIVVIGTGKPTAAILDPSKDILGDFYGHKIRSNFLTKPLNKGSIMVVKEPDTTSISSLSNCHLIVISGGDEMALSRWEISFHHLLDSKLTLLNCRVPIDDSIKIFARIDYFKGEFYGDPNYQYWKDLSASNPAVSVTDIPLCQAYMADWWPLLRKSDPK